MDREGVWRVCAWLEFRQVALRVSALGTTSGRGRLRGLGHARERGCAARQLRQSLVGFMVSSGDPGMILGADALGVLETGLMCYDPRSEGRIFVLWPEICYKGVDLGGSSDPSDLSSRPLDCVRLGVRAGAGWATMAAGIREKSESWGVCLQNRRRLGMTPAG